MSQTSLHRMSALASFISSNDAIRIFSSPKFASSKRLLVLDSSFNPPNRAHLKLVRTALSLSPSTPCSILFLFATTNADKAASTLEDYTHRMELMQRFRRDCELLVPQFKDAPFGWGITKHAKFVDKLNAIDFDGQIWFLAGFDTLFRILDQRYYDQPVSTALESFFAKAGICALTRQEDGVSNTPQDDVMKSIQLQEQWLENISRGETAVPSQWAQKIVLVKSDHDTQGVSSSVARKLVRDGRVDELGKIVTAQVQSYIIEHKLYSTNVK